MDEAQGLCGAAYDALADEFAALGELLSARQQAGMTQAEGAQRMGMAQAWADYLDGLRKGADVVPIRGTTAS